MMALHFFILLVMALGIRMECEQMFSKLPRK